MHKRLQENLKILENMTKEQDCSRPQDLIVLEILKDVVEELKEMKYRELLNQNDGK